jgi:hypothetical protein
MANRVDWENVLPAWFRVLSATAGPSEYAQRITTVLKRHYEHGRIDVRNCAQDCDAGATPGVAGARVRRSDSRLVHQRTRGPSGFRRLMRIQASSDTPKPATVRSKSMCGGFTS